jgi:transposase
MAKVLVDDELWAIIAPLLPAHRSGPGKRGRPAVDDRAALTGILFVLKSGIPWEMSPLEMGCGSGMTCWRRLRDWHEAGVWQRLPAILLARFQAAHLIDWSRASVDSVSVRAKGAKKGGLKARRLARRLWSGAGREPNAIASRNFVIASRNFVIKW